MKTSILLAILASIGFETRTRAEGSFECPVECSTDVYRPVCVRGKSYANLCVLRRDICNGNTPMDHYADVEACPGYETYEDANGESVEMVDKNGVIFRNLLDDPAAMRSSSPATIPTTRSIDRSTKKIGRHCGRRKRIPICRQTCFNPRKNERHPVCLLRNLCSIEFLMRIDATRAIEK